MGEMIVFVNKKNEKVIIEQHGNDYYEFEEFEFNVDVDTTIDKDLLHYDGYDLPTSLNIEKAFKPLKFYKIIFGFIETNTQDGYDCFDVISSFEDIDYINQ